MRAITICFLYKLIKLYYIDKFKDEIADYRILLLRHDRIPKGNALLLNFERTKRDRHAPIKSMIDKLLCEMLRIER